VSDFTTLLCAVGKGDRSAEQRLLELVYGELRSLAAHKLARERAGHTLQATALVHEAYLRLLQGESPQFENRRHFFGAAAEAMRRILVERARERGRLKRGGDRRRVELQDSDLVELPESLDLLALDEALEKLTAEDPEKADLVKLHFFTGLPLEDAGEMLGISRASAYRYWNFARAWLYEQMCSEPPQRDRRGNA
jgi:RNA polymerase sigma factor (TIGR02999 family)